MWEQKSADQGYSKAQVRLAVIYANGTGVPKDVVRALQWVIIAKAYGNPQADEMLKKLEQVMTPAHIDQAEAMARQWWDAHHPDK